MKEFVKNGKKLKSGVKKWIIPVVEAGIVLMVIVILLVRAAQKAVNLNEYVSLKIEGVDTMGKATLKWDYDGLDKAIAEATGKNIDEDSIEDWETFANVLSDMEEVSEASEGITMNIDKSENLSNGDRVKVTAVIDKNVEKQVGVKFKFKTIEQKVEGLKEAKTLTLDELYQDVNVEFTGTSPNAVIKITNNSTDPYLSTLKFMPKRDDGEIGNVGYVKGEKAVVTVEYDASEASNAGYILDDVDKEYEVKDVDAYALKFDELDKDTVKNIYDAAMGYFDKVLISKSIGLFGPSVHLTIDDKYGDLSYADGITNYDVDKVFLLTQKEDAAAAGYTNYVLMSVKFDVNGLSNSRGDRLGDYTGCYLGIYTSEVIVHSDGTIEANTDEEKISDAYATYDEYYNGEILDENFDVEEINWEQYKKDNKW